MVPVCAWQCVGARYISMSKMAKNSALPGADILVLFAFIQKNFLKCCEFFRKTFF